jgi:SAM-dependent methyltransferase
VPKAEWGADPEFFGPRHAHREARLLRLLLRLESAGGLHLECAAGVGSLAVALGRHGRVVVAADGSLRSLLVVSGRARRAAVDGRVLSVAADVTSLPFRNRSFATASSAETLEHVGDHVAAAAELRRVVIAGGWLVGSVPAGPRQWSAWDDWAGHLRRYTRAGLADVLTAAGWRPRLMTWGWPVVRFYDTLFLRRVNRRRLESRAGVGEDAGLRAVAGLGRRHWLVGMVRAAFALDRVFDGVPWGVGLLFVAQNPGP